MNRHVGEAILEQRLKALGARAKRPQVGVATVWAAPRLAATCAAVMALKART